MSDPTPNPTLTCPTCGMLPQDVKATNLIIDRMQYGDLYVCGGCGTVCKVGLLNLEAVAEERFNELPEDVKRDVTFARRAVVRHIRES